MANIASIVVEKTDPELTSQPDLSAAPQTTSSSPKRPRVGTTRETKPAKLIAKPGAPRSESKTDLVLKKLRTTRGATIESLMEATAWQAHSVRGFLSATVRKKLGLQLSSEVGKDGIRRYRIGDAGKGA